MQSTSTINTFYGELSQVKKNLEEDVSQALQEKFHREGWLGERAVPGYSKGMGLMAAVNALAIGSLSSSSHRTAEFTAKGASAKAKAKRKASRTARKANKQRLKGGK